MLLRPMNCRTLDETPVRTVQNFVMGDMEDCSDSDPGDLTGDDSDPVQVGDDTADAQTSAARVYCRWTSSSFGYEVF